MAKSGAQRQAEFRARRKAEAGPVLVSALTYLDTLASDQWKDFHVIDGEGHDVTEQLRADRAALAEACRETIIRFG